MASTDVLSPEDKEFLAKCEDELKDRYTEKDEEFMKVFTAEPSDPPIVDSWWVPNNAGRRNDRRINRRNSPYERHGNRNYSDRHDKRDNYEQRNYSDHDRGSQDRGYGGGYNRYQRPRYY